MRLDRIKHYIWYTNKVTNTRKFFEFSLVLQLYQKRSLFRYILDTHRCLSYYPSAKKGD